MKCILILLFPMAVSAQSFELTQNGFASKEDLSKDYIVFEYPGASQVELFNKVIQYTHKTFRSPKDVISKTEYGIITINGEQPRSVRRNKMHVFDLNYTVPLEFKDGKIKVNAPGFKLSAYTSRPQELFLVANNSLDGSRLGIYNSKMELKSKLAKEDLELFINTLIFSLKESLAKTDDW